MKKPTSEDVKRYREEHQVSLFEAHDTLMKEWAEDVVTSQPNLSDDLIDVLLFLIDKVK